METAKEGNLLHSMYGQKYAPEWDIAFRNEISILNNNTGL